MPRDKLKFKPGDTIKVGRREFVIKRGDYILDNNVCFQFITGDRRTLYHIKIGRYNQGSTNIQLPKKLVKIIDFESLKLAEKPDHNQTLKYYYIL